MRTLLSKLFRTRPAPTPERRREFVHPDTGMTDLQEMIWMKEFPPIPPHEREAAQKRLNRPLDIRKLRFPDGSVMDFVAGPAVDIRDYTRARGYTVVPVGFDKWGYRLRDLQPKEG